MSALTITHTHAAGSLIDGTSRGDGSGEILKDQRWRWSRNLQSWYVPQSRDRRAKLAHINATAAALRAAGFTVEIEIDDTYRQVADVEADKITRQEDRVDALNAKADRKASDADDAWDAERAAYAALPEGGEPIKIGHHSERRHRAAIDKAWNTLGKAVHAERDAATARGRADAAARTTDHRYAPQTVARRIDKLAAELRGLERNRDGYSRTLHTNKQTGEKYTEDHAPASGADRERALDEIEHTSEKLAYWQGVRAQQIADGTVTLYSRDVIAKGDHVFYVGQWNEVVKVNAKTVTIRSIVGGGWNDRIAYSEIRNLRDAEARPIRIADGQRVTAPVGETTTDHPAGVAR
ncbi:DUF3560 domain-containing protein [Rhodococcus sp. NCIMB 12038]|uniref:DUF3560 domain-containing protein n=1 Tax=Rhodococcus sp. NCIMB 12038 TaxID=933800 RepID=UPI000B3D243E|nr:DUF3560 domain-containing protein [Rhodococcus sp. NCIMB 12038]OUS97387.1 hypothetical protein CA951_03315 [Rhodococcus sp. NCIMB 12038]